MWNIVNKRQRLFFGLKVTRLYLPLDNMWSTTMPTMKPWETGTVARCWNDSDVKYSTLFFDHLRMATHIFITNVLHELHLHNNPHTLRKFIGFCTFVFITNKISWYGYYDILILQLHDIIKSDISCYFLNLPNGQCDCTPMKFLLLFALCINVSLALQK